MNDMPKNHVAATGAQPRSLSPFIDSLAIKAIKDAFPGIDKQGPLFSQLHHQIVEMHTNGSDVNPSAIAQRMRTQLQSSHESEGGERMAILDHYAAYLDSASAKNQSERSF